VSSSAGLSYKSAQKGISARDLEHPNGNQKCRGQAGYSLTFQKLSASFNAYHWKSQGKPGAEPFPPGAILD
jgi:hypothetical protein